jgi:hypothetical protein
MWHFRAYHFRAWHFAQSQMAGSEGGPPPETGAVEWIMRHRRRGRR